jgi:hypothetical protein
MRFQRKLWRIKKNLRTFVITLLIRWGLIEPLGRCPVCRKGLRLITKPSVERRPDGTTVVLTNHFVGCPACDYECPREESSPSTQNDL